MGVACKINYQQIIKILFTSLVMLGGERKTQGGKLGQRQLQDTLTT